MWPALIFGCLQLSHNQMGRETTLFVLFLIFISLSPELTALCLVALHPGPSSRSVLSLRPQTPLADSHFLSDILRLCDPNAL